MRYLTILLILISFLSCSPKQQLSQDNREQTVEVAEEVVEEVIEEVIEEAESFPEAWYGKWRGNLEIYNNKGKAQDVPMEIHIEPTDSVNRTKMALIYGEGEKMDARPYELVTIDEEKGHYQTDEKNTIFLDDYYFSGVLYSRFEVMGNLLLTRIEKRNNHLYFEVISGKSEPINTTGGDEANKIPDVNSYNIFVSQRAELVKY